MGNSKRALDLSIVLACIFLAGNVVLASSSDFDALYADIVVKLRPIDAPQFPPYVPPDETKQQEPPIVEQPPKEQNQPILDDSGPVPNENYKPNNIMTYPDVWNAPNFAWSNWSTWFEQGLDTSRSSFEKMKMEVSNNFQQMNQKAITQYQMRSSEIRNMHLEFSQQIGMHMSQEWQRLNQYVDMKLNMGKQKLEQWDNQWRMMSQEMDRFSQKVQDGMRQ